MSVEGPSAQPFSENIYKEIIAKTERRHRLLNAQWELTYRCNEKCTHCYLDVFAPHADVPGELTTEECIRIIDELAAAGALNLTFSGGEILVRRDFFEIAEYAHSKRFLLRLFTNGILINPEIADRIAALHPYAVEISVYSSIAEKHDKITQLRHSFELSTRALRLLHERGVRTVLKTPLMRENARELHDLRNLAAELGAQFRFDPTITPKDSGGLAPLQHRLTYEDLLWVFRETIAPETWVGRAITSESRTCGITLNSIAVDPYGNVFPCLQTRSKAGNLRNQTLAEIWSNSPVWQQLGHLTLSELPVCNTCELKNLCVRCHGLALAEDGDLRGPAMVNCREALARRQVLIEMGALRSDYPIPAHLRDLAAANHLETHQRGEESLGSFIPISALAVRRQDTFALPVNR